MFGHFFYGRLLPFWSFLLWEAAPILSLFFDGRLLPYLVISSMGGWSHFKPFLLWEAAPMFGHFFRGRLLPS